MAMGMQKSGKILESCVADLENADVPDWLYPSISYMSVVKLSGIPVISLSLTNLCHQMLLLSLNCVILLQMSFCTQYHKSDCYCSLQYRKFYHLKASF